jgi:DNA-binding MarR family transcriptional regulator
MHFAIHYFYEKIFFEEISVNCKVPMTTPKHPLAREALHKFLLIHRYLRQIARQIDEHSIRPRQFAVLLYLRDVEEATVSEIQDYLYTSPSSASSTISELEGAGHVTRTRSESDNRIVLVRLTPSGQELAQRIPQRGISLLRRRLDNLDETRLQRLDQALADLMELMEVEDTE